MDEENSMRGQALKDGLRVERMYETFSELYGAILENGPLIVTGPEVDVMFVAISGEFDGHIMALRQSGRNVRRFLIREDTFEDFYGTVQNCLDHVRSNSAVDCELELKHLRDIGERLGLSPTEIDSSRTYDRLEIDVVAALQLMQLATDLERDDPEIFHAFELGYCVGRLFSSAQSLATLEPDANKAGDYERSYKERGKKGKSRDRKRERLDHLFRLLNRLVQENPALSRLKPIEVGRLALADAVEENPRLWTQGKGQLESYLTSFASDPEYRKVYRELFPKTG